MKTPRIIAALFTALALVPVTVRAQGTAFTYQGFLTSQGAPANGSFDLQFAVFDAVSGGAQQGFTVQSNSVGITNGLFTVTIDPGANVFTGAGRWLNIGVRPAGGASFTNVVPRQAITAAPYATHAAYAGDIEPGANVSFSANGVVSFNSPTPFILGPLATNVVNNLNAQYLAGKDAGRFWWLGGNSGQLPSDYVLGTLDNQPLELRVNGQRALRVEPNSISPNLVGGYSGNIISNGVGGGFIGGGGDIANPNRVGANYASVLGGSGNTASGDSSIAMGSGTTASAYASTAMGVSTKASGNVSTAMGVGTTASGIASIAIGSGGGTTASGTRSIAMGYRAKANHQGSFVWADTTEVEFASTANNQFLLRASGGVGIGTNNPNATLHIPSPGDFTAPQVAISQLNTNDFARLQIGVSTFPQWVLSVQPGATPELRFWNGSANVAYLTYNGALFAQSFNPTSDRNAKENFAAVNPQEVLDKVVGLPISRWNFKGEGQTAHVGPMAQDFHAAFGLGTDDKHIATVDADGVALAAIQGLNQKLEEQKAENAELKRELAEIKKLLQALNR